MGKGRSIGILLLAEMAAMSLWFISSAILPDMLREVEISPVRQAALSSGVQLGFVAGALLSAFLGLADRFDPRRVFAAAAFAAAIVNATLLISSPDSLAAIAARFLTGALMAGIYPVGMKIAVGWGQQDRGFLVGLLVGALTLGSALPHLIAFAGGANWRLAVIVASAAAAVAGLLVFAVALGPHHGKAARFDPRVITSAWTNRRVRLAYAGYLGHMWELYAMWAWIGAATAVSYGYSLSEPAALSLSKLTAFLAIGIGAATSIFAGFVADRLGKAEVAIIALALSGLSALLTARDLRRSGLAHPRPRDHLGHDGHPRFRAILRPGRGCLARRAGRQPDDAADRLGLRAYLRHRAGHADAGRLARLAGRARQPGARACLRHHRHAPPSRHDPRSVILFDILSSL